MVVLVHHCRLHTEGKCSVEALLRALELFRTVGSAAVDMEALRLRLAGGLYVAIRRGAHSTNGQVANKNSETLLHFDLSQRAARRRIRPVGEPTGQS